MSYIMCSQHSQQLQLLLFIYNTKDMSDNRILFKNFGEETEFSIKKYYSQPIIIQFDENLRAFFA